MAKVENISGIPKTEKIWVSYLGRDGKRKYVLTSGPYREKYILYVVEEDGAAKKLGECESPIQLERKFNVLREIGKAR